jgi:hypothetical protein
MLTAYYLFVYTSLNGLLLTGVILVNFPFIIAPLSPPNREVNSETYFAISLRSLSSQSQILTFF